MAVSISTTNFSAFEKAYKKVLLEEQDSFQFEGQEVLTTFAKYLIEHVKFQTIKKNGSSR